MGAPNRTVGQPFASDPWFWVSVRASGYALVLLVGAAALTAFLGRPWAATFLAPAVLLALAAATGRLSSRRSRTAFDDRRLWRDAERQAVAHAFVPALLWRNRWGP